LIDIVNFKVDSDNIVDKYREVEQFFIDNNILHLKDEFIESLSVLSGKHSRYKVIYEYTNEIDDFDISS
jgi:hypothetical protein